MFNVYNIFFPSHSPSTLKILCVLCWMWIWTISYTKRRVNILQYSSSRFFNFIYTKFLLALLRLSASSPTRDYWCYFLAAVFERRFISALIWNVAKKKSRENKWSNVEILTGLNFVELSSSLSISPNWIRRRLANDQKIKTVVISSSLVVQNWSIAKFHHTATTKFLLAQIQLSLFSEQSKNFLRCSWKIYATKFCVCFDGKFFDR
jgi:hypothetical protein